MRNLTIAEDEGNVASDKDVQATVTVKVIVRAARTQARSGTAMANRRPKPEVKPDVASGSAIKIVGFKRCQKLVLLPIVRA